jgi:hypothetical protein
MLWITLGGQAVARIIAQLWNQEKTKRLRGCILDYLRQKEINIQMVFKY